MRAVRQRGGVFDVAQGRLRGFGSGRVRLRRDRDFELVGHLKSVKN
jgi:hypothetical protein